jgi:DNA-directed RNA polymerase specialized sigma24 family protein
MSAAILNLFSHLRRCTALLSPSLRRTFQLRVVNGLSIVETAQVLGLPHGTVKAQLARARRRLTRSMLRERSNHTSAGVPHEQSRSSGY